MDHERDATTPGRIADYETDDDTVVVYDTKNETAWIESTVSELLSWKT